MATIDAFLDENHLLVLGLLPPDLMDLCDIEAARVRLAALGDALPAPEMPATVGLELLDVPGRGAEDPAVPLRVYRPTDVQVPAPVLYWIHGGGLVLGEAAMNDPDCARWADLFGVVVVSVDYRLAPEHPYPAPLDDCYAGLTWLESSADDLGVDAGRIVVGGASAGGGLAAALALLARDQGGPAVTGQFLEYPMLDDRNTTASSHAITDGRVWNRQANLAGWNAYLEGRAGEDDVSAYAAPARATDLAGLPPAYINVGTVDMFHDEDVAYAMALHSAGVPVELHTYPGAFHASNKFVADSDLAQRWAADDDAALARMLAR